jgi:hypothetical protein
MSKENNNTDNLKGFLQKNSIIITMYIITSIITILNLYTASLISPLKSDIQRVEAITLQNQRTLDKKEVLIDRIEVVVTKLEILEKRIDRIENKLDR